MPIKVRELDANLFAIGFSYFYGDRASENIEPQRSVGEILSLAALFAFYTMESEKRKRDRRTRHKEQGLINYKGKQRSVGEILSLAALLAFYIMESEKRKRDRRTRHKEQGLINYKSHSEA